MAPSRNEPTSPVEDSDAEASQDESGSEDSAPASDEEAASDEEGDEGSESGSASGSGGEDEEQSGSEDGESESEDNESAAETPVTSKASATKKATSTKAPADKTGGQAADVAAPRVLVARTPVPGKPNGPRSRPGASSLAPAEATHDTQEGSSTGLSRQHRDASDRGNDTEDDAAVAHQLHYALNPGHTLSSHDVPNDSETPASAATEVEDPAPASSSSPRRALRKKRDFSHLKNLPSSTPEDSSTKDEAPPEDDDTDPESEEEAKRRIQARDRALATGRDAQEKRHRDQSTTRSEDDDASQPLPNNSSDQKAAADEAKKKATKKGRRAGVQFDTDGRTAVSDHDEAGDEEGAAQKKARDERARKHISTIGHEVDAQQERQQEKARGTRFADEDQTPADQAETRDRLRDLKSSKPAKTKTTSTKESKPPPGPSKEPKKDDNDKSGKGGAKPSGSGHVPTSGFENPAL